jgi:hypothetical protein
MEILIESSGNVRCVYGEAIDLNQLGRANIRRGSHVEPTEGGFWSVDLSPVDGPCLGPFKHRSEALQAEIRWLSKHWLVPDSSRHSNQ